MTDSSHRQTSFVFLRIQNWLIKSFMEMEGK